jgi:6-pyruvoyltetrahydropterin/6-carboxytetrahydropterin synthase
MKMTRGWTVTKTFTARVAHRIPAHPVCGNVHGEFLTISLTVEPSDGKLPPDGMVIDFGEIKGVFGKWIDQNLDHTMIVGSDDTAVIVFLQENGWRMYIMPPGEIPTSEYLARHLFHVAKKLFISYPISIVGVEIVESANNKAYYGH